MTVTLFLDNKYTRWYYNIITKCQQRNDGIITNHNHHIIPKSFFACNKNGWIDGDQHYNNIVRLTAKEHYL